MQFQAGYVSDPIAHLIRAYRKSLSSSPEEFARRGQMDGLLEHVCTFDVEFGFSYTRAVDFSKLNPVLAVLSNMVCRGLPTRAPEGLEKHLEEVGLTVDLKEKYKVEYGFNGNIDLSFEKLFQLLHIIEPGLQIDYTNYGGDPGSNLEWSYISDHPWLLQILQSQRDFETINKHFQGGRTVDFSYSPQYQFWNDGAQRNEKRDLIIEVDGPHHFMRYQKYYDEYRDEVAELNGFSTLRLHKVSYPKEVKDDFIEAVGREHFHTYESNYELSIPENLKEYSLIYIPLAVARIQKTLIECFNARPELLEKDEIKLAVIERDLPCGAMAVQLFEEMVSHLNAILNEEQQLFLPPIDLHVFPEKNWSLDDAFHGDALIGNADNFNPSFYDLILDHSILRRYKVYNEDTLVAEQAVKIRSTHFVNRSFGCLRRTYCSELLFYKPLVDRREDGSYKKKEEAVSHLVYFLQTIFRKRKFREGQVPILSRALQYKPAIGLLPTGGGKSLTFQLAAFLQPGICVVVDPIKSLMEDQVRVLKENWIDCCAFINSNIKPQRKRKRLIDFRYGESMFLFVSPERFVIDEFRQIVQSLNSSVFGLAVSYAVIDEVHCVSEWGHDFRTTYLMLGHNAQKFCATRSGRPVNLIGLTATASFDVLADVERELKIENDDVAEAIIMIENTIRPELFFRIVDCTKDTNRIDILKQDFSQMGGNLKFWNRPELLKKSIEHHQENFDDKNIEENDEINTEEEIVEQLLTQMTIQHPERLKVIEGSSNGITAIIFCVVKGEGGNLNGVNYVYESLDSDSKTFFYSSDDRGINELIQKNFRDFIYGEKKHMVCTKAFGMGIDKEDVRSVYHYIHSGSLESFVQEAGRAGRDKSVSEAVTLFSRKRSCVFLLMQFFFDHFENVIIHNVKIRKTLREKLEQYWNKRTGRFERVYFENFSDAINKISATYFTDDLNLNSQLIELLLSKNENGDYYYLIEHGDDRSIHDFFHRNSFKGAGIEKSQFLNAFLIKEFTIVDDEKVVIPDQKELIKEIGEREGGSFEFAFTFRKAYDSAAEIVCRILKLDPDYVPYGSKDNKAHISSMLNFSLNFQDFLFGLEERINVQIHVLTDVEKERLLLVFGRDRDNQVETGRLIYRMHCMGLLRDFKIDYATELFICSLFKSESIDYYVERINEYLARYLSHIGADSLTQSLRSRLNGKKYEDQILECLYFLSEFAYKEIVSKRLAATDEIERVLLRASSEEVVEQGRYEQNRIIKEEIFFYFNAKYARLDFRIDGRPFSLLSDFNKENSKTEDFRKDEVLFKYLYALEIGLEQNNYKHMIGSCRKIQRSLPATDASKEWMLHLLLAFSLYAVGQSSYFSEANDSIKRAFKNLYTDEAFHENKWARVDNIIKGYFNELSKKLENNNEAFESMEIVRISVLTQIQNRIVNELLLN